MWSLLPMLIWSLHQIVNIFRLVTTYFPPPKMCHKPACQSWTAIFYRYSWESTNTCFQLVFRLLHHRQRSFFEKYIFLLLILFLFLCLLKISNGTIFEDGTSLLWRFQVFFEHESRFNCSTSLFVSIKKAFMWTGISCPLISFWRWQLLMKAHPQLWKGWNCRRPSK